MAVCGDCSYDNEKGHYKEHDQMKLVAWNNYGLPLCEDCYARRRAVDATKM